jgi:hypothetical protein
VGSFLNLSPSAKENALFLEESAFRPLVNQFGEEDAAAIRKKALNIPNNASVGIIFDGIVQPELLAKISADISGYNSFVELDNGNTGYAC